MKNQQVTQDTIASLKKSCRYTLAQAGRKDLYHDLELFFEEPASSQINHLDLLRVLINSTDYHNDLNLFAIKYGLDKAHAKAA